MKKYLTFFLQLDLIAEIATNSMGVSQPDFKVIYSKHASIPQYYFPGI